MQSGLLDTVFGGVFGFVGGTCLRSARFRDIVGRQIRFLAPSRVRPWFELPHVGASALPKTDNRAGRFRLLRVSGRMQPLNHVGLARYFDHLDLHQLETASDRIREIVAALDVLEHNLRIGRLVRVDMRELVIGRHAHGYTVLYRYVAQWIRSWPSAASLRQAIQNPAQSKNHRVTFMTGDELAQYMLGGRSREQSDQRAAIRPTVTNFSPSPKRCSAP